MNKIDDILDIIGITTKERPESGSSSDLKSLCDNKKNDSATTTRKSSSTKKKLSGDALVTSGSVTTGTYGDSIVTGRSMEEGTLEKGAEALEEDLDVQDQDQGSSAHSAPDSNTESCLDLSFGSGGSVEVRVANSEVFLEVESEVTTPDSGVMSLVSSENTISQAGSQEDIMNR